MARAAEAALGVWLVLAGLFLSGPESPAQLTAMVGGAALILLVLAERPARARRHVGLSVVLVGCALMMAPLVLGYAVQAEALREVLTGFAVAAVALLPGTLGRGVRRPLRT
jgi:hypothetical protein